MEERAWLFLVYCICELSFPKSREALSVFSLANSLEYSNCQSGAGANVWEWPENHDSKSNTWAPIVASVIEYK